MSRLWAFVTIKEALERDIQRQMKAKEVVKSALEEHRRAVQEAMAEYNVLKETTAARRQQLAELESEPRYFNWQIIYFFETRSASQAILL